ncbi:MAG: LPS export ABC transporter permease LptG [Bacteroidetes bacterium]|nr:LPS export ABC transporter permease LptG [Bacteroidota bacterium]
MKILDRYILRQFILSAFFGLLAFTLIFVIIDLMENLDDFLDHNVEAGIILQYYISFIPEIIKLMTPVAILLSSLFTTGKYSSSNELTAMKAGGMSIYRYMTPIVLFSLGVSLFSVYFSGWVVPYADKHKFDIERKYLQKNLETLARTNIYLQDGKRRIIYISFFDGYSNSGSRVSIQDFSDDRLLSISQRFDGSQIFWDSASHSWTMKNVTKRIITPHGNILTKYASLKFDTLSITPKEIIKKIDKPQEMDYTELGRFIQRQQQSGNDVARWQVDYHSRISFPFASVIVVLFGVPFAFGKRRGGVALQFGISVAICFIYMAFMKISEVFGYNGDIHPMLTAWLANIIFFTGGIVNIFRVNK